MMSVLAGLIFTILRNDVPKIDISTPEFAAHYCSLRYYATNPETQVPEGMGEGVHLIREIDEALPDSITLRSGERKARSKEDRRVKDLYWSLLDSQVLSAASLAEFKSRTAMMPEKIGGYLETKPTFTKLQDALAKSESAAKANSTVGKEIVSKRLAEWYVDIVLNRNFAYGFLLDRLVVKKLPSRIKVLVVPQLAGKGGITLRTLDGVLVVIGCNRFEGMDFEEVLIHETIHALDAMESNVGMFVTLRRELAEAKVDQSVIEQIVHTMVFMHAAEAVRKSVNVDHKDVGDTFGIYKSGIQKHVDLLREPLRKYWASEITLEQLSKQVMKALGTSVAKR